ncbi:hypothetical protein ACFL12_01165 [Pseudomonadota bacterium]
MSEKIAQPVFNVTPPTLDLMLPESFHDVAAARALGNFKTYLQNPNIRQVKINFSLVTWCDAEALMGLAATLASYKREDMAVDLDFGRGANFQGDEARRKNHKIFLKFMTTQDFLKILAEHASRLIWESSEYEYEELYGEFAHFPVEAHFTNADFIRAKLFKASEYSTREQAHELTERLVVEATKRAITPVFSSAPETRDRLLQKMRKLLFELIHNAAEHAYAKDGYFCIFGRIRGACPAEPNRAHRWREYYKKERATCLPMNRFTPTKNADWLELFVLDVGDGLLAHLSDWRTTKKETIKAIKKAKASKDPLFVIGPFFFNEPISRLARHDTDRTEVTGLQYLGHVLKIDHDFVRIWTDGCYLSGKHPWVPDSAGHRKAEYKSLPGGRADALPGTAYKVCIQPKGGRTPYKSDDWIIADRHDRKRIAEMLCVASYKGADVSFFERLNSGAFTTPSEDEVAPLLQKLGSSSAIVVVRPPRLVNKTTLQDWLQWMQDDRVAAQTIIFCELSPFQALELADLLPSLSTSKWTVGSSATKTLDVYLVSEEWAIHCSRSDPSNPRRLITHAKGAKRFMSENTSFGIADLAVLLRRADSDIFWADPGDIHVNGKIKWPEPSGEEPEIDGYLDLPQALACPTRYRACKRALRRCLSLFPDLSPISTDDLVGFLLADANNGIYREGELRAGNMAVGSICVTASTVDRYRTRRGYDVQSVVHLFIHPSYSGPLVKGSLVALEWTSFDTEACRSVGSGWSRIPNTPYIAENGEKAFSVFRFSPPASGDLHNKYGRSPVQMYADFEALSCLKIGHWKYGERHDLLTVNLARAFSLDAIGHGPMLTWLRSEVLAILSSVERGKTLLVYPSHPVTDQIIRALRQADGGINDDDGQCLLEDNQVVPLKYLDKASVSPFRLSPLIEEALKGKLSSGASTVIIFDDATISGKIFRETTQFLQHIGFKDIKTIVLVDRSGLPINDGLWDRFFNQHRRYWRLDAPPLGHEHHCPLCAAISRVEAFSEQFSETELSDRAKEWSEIWKISSVESDWLSHGSDSVLLGRQEKLTFGFTNDDERVPVEHSGSTSLATQLIELGRVTTRTDVALRRARGIASEQPEAALEVIAAQILLFFDELSHWEKLDRYVALFQILGNLHEPTKRTALAGLVLTLTDRDLIQDLWPEIREQYINDKRISNVDMQLAAMQLRRFWMEVTGRADELPFNPTREMRDNQVLLDPSPDFMRALALIFRIIGWHSAGSHDSWLRKLLLGDEELNQFQREKIVDELFSLRDSINRISIDNLYGGRSDNRESPRPSPKGDGEEISKFISQIREHDEANWRRPLTDFLFGMADSASGLHIRYTEFFMRELEGHTAVHSLLNEEIGEVKSRWAEIIGSKNTEFTCPEPIILSAPKMEQVSIGVIFYDPLIQQGVQDLLSNVCHTGGKKTVCPQWWLESKNHKEKAHMWWRVTPVRDGFLEIELANSADIIPIKLKPSPGLTGIERSRGSVDIELVRCSDGKVISPSDEEKDEETGTTTLAVTHIRIPTRETMIKG